MTANRNSQYILSNRNKFIFKRAFRLGAGLLLALGAATTNKAFAQGSQPLPALYYGCDNGEFSIDFTQYGARISPSFFQVVLRNADVIRYLREKGGLEVFSINEKNELIVQGIMYSTSHSFDSRGAGTDAVPWPLYLAIDVSLGSQSTITLKVFEKTLRADGTYNEEGKPLGDWTFRNCFMVR